MFASLTRRGWQDRSAAYLVGLMTDGRRKSVQPMAARLGEVNEQSLQHFLANTPWDPVPVRAAIARRMYPVVQPAGWVVDDTGYPKSGTSSPCVARQYSGTLGKTGNCQVSTTVHLASDEASCPVNWRLFVPESWDPGSVKAPSDIAHRRARCALPEAEVHREKWRLALDAIDEILDWDIPVPPVLVADCGYGSNAYFRHGLTQRGIRYAVQVAEDLRVLPAGAVRTTVPYSGLGPRPLAVYRDEPVTVKAFITARGHRAAVRVAWRIGSKMRHGRHRPMASRFVFTRVRPAGVASRRLHKGQDLPEVWLIAEWPASAKEPTRYWLSDLPAAMGRSKLIAACKLRWRVEHDYRELKTGLGLDHYEGRKWAGWHHHVTLVAAAHAFCTLQRLHPKVHAPA
ncbi:SRSO17 transposase [Longispora fulva]|uniref:SRSO17 transposase n=1 Tax=Longispora fulva TaxID=619741 RepID=A0A8J7KIQ4_9ACTN|nr:SRSO17 transposase [Longispora fulva]